MLPVNHRSAMASRREPPDSLDFFPTPPWATRALLRDVLPLALRGEEVFRAWDPAAGEGHMAEVLREALPIVHASDIFDYGRGYRVMDFLAADTGRLPRVELIATNPPFNGFVDFALRALALAPVVAFLLPPRYLEGSKRYEAVFRDNPLTLYAPFVERVPMVKGVWDPTASTATAYAWFIWVRGAEPLPLFQIPPGRRKLYAHPDDISRFARVADAPLLKEEDEWASPL